MRPLTVDGREVDGLRSCAHFTRHAGEINIEDQRRGLPMDVAAGLECSDERGIAGKMREQAQLDLRIVRRDEYVTGGRNKPASNVAPQLTANRDVLKVGIARRQTARGRDSLVEGRVDAIRPRIHE